MTQNPRLLFADHRWLRAIRKGFLSTLPIVMAGAAVLLLINLPLPGWQQGMSQLFGAEFRPALQAVWQATLGALSMMVVFAISHALAVLSAEERVEESCPLAAALVALSCFSILALSGNGLFASGSTVPRGVLVSVVTAILATELFLFLRRQVTAKVFFTADADFELLSTLRSGLPAVLTIAIFFLLQFTLLAPGFSSADNFVDHLVSQLFSLTDSALLRCLIFVLLNQLLWFAGVHGSNTLELYYRDYLEPASALNISAAASGSMPSEVITNAFVDAYIFIGGSGSTMGLLIALMLVARKGTGRNIARFALPPVLFNINEILIFGLPIIFNPIYLIPFVATPLILVLLSFAALSWGLVPLNTAAVIWSTPVFLNAWFAADSWQGPLLQIFNIGIATLIYLPFVRRSEVLRSEAAQIGVRKMIDQVEVLLRSTRQALVSRNDDIGLFARTLLADLREDLQSERIWLAYQPKLDQAGQVVGVEALFRWRHERYGQIPPHIAIGILEDAGYINEYGRWSIDAACRQLSIWQKAGISGFSVAVNLSPAQLGDPDLLAHVRRCLRHYALDASSLELEITESNSVSNDTQSNQTIEALGELGVKLAMDDFGMGYSSLLYIRRFRIDAIKLDGSLTREVLENASCREIISTVAQLCRSKGIRLVAEYVETQPQRDLLLSLGCDEFQGYLYSPALRADDCARFIRECNAG